MSINRVSISGNLTREPELKAAGTLQILRFSVAVNERRKNNQTGEWEDKPNFIDCTMFGTRAEKIATLIHKGSKVAIDGKLSQSSWDDRQTGAKRSKIEVIVQEIEFMSARGTQQAAPQAQQAQLFDSDIPF